MKEKKKHSLVDQKVLLHFAKTWRNYGIRKDLFWGRLPTELWCYCKKTILVLAQVLGGSSLKFQGKEKPKQPDQVESLFCLLLWAITAQVTNGDYLCSGFSMLPFNFQSTSVNHLRSSTAKKGKMNDDITQWNKLRQKKILKQQKNPVWKETQNKEFSPLLKYTIKSIKGTHIISFPLGHNYKLHNGKRHSKQVGQKNGANAWLIWKYLSPVADLRTSASPQEKAPAALHTHGLDQPLAHEWQSKNLTSCRTLDIAQPSAEPPGHRVWGDQRRYWSLWQVALRYYQHHQKSIWFSGNKCFSLKQVTPSLPGDQISHPPLFFER